MSEIEDQQREAYAELDAFIAESAYASYTDWVQTAAEPGRPLAVPTDYDGQLGLPTAERFLTGADKYLYLGEHLAPALEDWLKKVVRQAERELQVAGDTAFGSPGITALAERVGVIGARARERFGADFLWVKPEASDGLMLQIWRRSGLAGGRYRPLTLDELTNGRLTDEQFKQLQRDSLLGSALTAEPAET